MGGGASKREMNARVVSMPKSVINGPNVAMLKTGNSVVFSLDGEEEYEHEKVTMWKEEGGHRTSPNEEAMMENTTIFATTFNINASPLPPTDALALLHDKGAGNNDVICLGFQECGTCNLNGVNLPIPVNDWLFERGVTVAGGDRFSEDANMFHNDEFVAAILNAVGGREAFAVLADVAIGEPPSAGKSEVMGKMVEWYGYVRLIVLVKVGHPLSSNYQDVKTAVCPVGDKPSIFPPHVYPNNTSPDKGAVCVVLEKLNMCIVVAHLYGTNKYGVGEKVFDKKRRTQLDVITEAFDTVVGGRLSTMNRIVMGDFNFRVEVHGGVEETEKGGKDWQAVNDYLKRDWKGESMEAKDSGIRELFYYHDRLNQWMVRKGEWKNPKGFAITKRDKDGEFEGEIPALFRGTTDGITKRKGDFCYPTFTFKIGDNDLPREFEKKRTPSWTDRILYTSKLELLDVGVERSIVISDHEPVYATFQIRMCSC